MSSFLQAIERVNNIIVDKPQTPISDLISDLGLVFIHLYYLEEENKRLTLESLERDGKLRVQKKRIAIKVDGRRRIISMMDLNMQKHLQNSFIGRLETSVLERSKRTKR